MLDLCIYVQDRPSEVAAEADDPVSSMEQLPG